MDGHVDWSVGSNVGSSWVVKVGRYRCEWKWVGIDK